MAAVIAQAQAAVTSTSASATSVTLTLGSNPVPGNLLVAYLVNRVTLWTVPAGWTQAQHSDDLPDTAIMYRVVNAGDGKAYTFSYTGAAGVVLGRLEEWGGATGWVLETVGVGTSSAVTTVALGAGSGTLPAPQQPSPPLYAQELTIALASMSAIVSAPSFSNSIAANAILTATTGSLSSGNRVTTQPTAYASTSASWTTSANAAIIVAVFAVPLGVTPALKSDWGPGEEMARLRAVIPARNTWIGGTTQSDSTVGASGVATPKPAIVQLLALLRARPLAALLPQQHLFTGATVASDSAITGTGLLAQHPLTARQLDLLRHRTMQALLPQQHVFTGATIASDSTISATGSVAPVVNLVQRMRNLQPPKAPYRSVQTVNTGAAIASDATLTGTGRTAAADLAVRFLARLRSQIKPFLPQQHLGTGATVASDATATATGHVASVVPVLQWMTRLRTPDQATPLQGNYSAGATIQSDSTLTGTGTNESGTPVETPTQQVGATWDRVPHRIGDRLPGEQQFDFDFELETLVLMLAVTV